MSAERPQVLRADWIARAIELTVGDGVYTDDYLLRLAEGIIDNYHDPATLPTADDVRGILRAASPVPGRRES